MAQQLPRAPLQNHLPLLGRHLGINTTHVHQPIPAGHWRRHFLRPIGALSDPTGGHSLRVLAVSAHAALWNVFGLGMGNHRHEGCVCDEVEFADSDAIGAVESDGCYASW